MGDVLFTADTHFNHRWMAEHRGFDSVEDMNESLRSEWNAVVGKRDTVYHLGDFAFGNEDAVKAAFRGLNGAHKHLIVGNHDNNNVKRLGWHSVEDMGKFRHNGQTAWLLHYPMLTWPNAHHGSWHLHGHSHGNLQAPSSTRMDVGMDATGNIAISWDEIVATMALLSYDFVDHHDREEN